MPHADLLKDASYTYDTLPTHTRLYKDTHAKLTKHHVEECNAPLLAEGSYATHAPPPTKVSKGSSYSLRQCRKEKDLCM